ncbi:MAG: hypothetical protein WEB90_03085 [Gemmatimonadota bacterium]
MIAPIHRVRAAGTAALLLLTGAALGITVDRVWLSAPPIESMSLTAGAMSERLGLSPEEAERLSVLLDSLHAQVAAAAVNGPEALRAATDAAHRRIEASLPTESRPAFHSWMQEHREHMMQQMRMGPMMHGG